jgi:hypothetical protein
MPGRCASQAVPPGAMTALGPLRDEPPEPLTKEAFDAVDEGGDATFAERLR